MNPLQHRVTPRAAVVAIMLAAMIPTVGRCQGDAGGTSDEQEILTLSRDKWQWMAERKVDRNGTGDFWW